MSFHEFSTLLILQILVILIGLAISVRSFGLYFQQNAGRSFLYLGIGFTVFSLGMTIETILLNLNVDLSTVHTLETIFAIIGLASIIVAILSLDLE